MNCALRELKELRSCRCRKVLKTGIVTVLWHLDNNGAQAMCLRSNSVAVYFASELNLNYYNEAQTRKKECCEDGIVLGPLNSYCSERFVHALQYSLSFMSS